MELTASHYRLRRIIPNSCAEGARLGLATLCADRYYAMPHDLQSA